MKIGPSWSQYFVLTISKLKKKKKCFAYHECFFSFCCFRIVIFLCLAADEFQRNNIEQTREYLSACLGLQ